MSNFTVAVIKTWNGFEGYAEDGYGELHRFLRDEVHPRDVWHFEPDFSIIIPETGMIQLSTAAFSRYIEETEVNEFKLEDICADEQN